MHFAVSIWDSRKCPRLGIEEQRAGVIADFVDSPDGLGDGYCVDADRDLGESERFEGPSERSIPHWAKAERVCD
jgi:hypothetical protein